MRIFAVTASACFASASLLSSAPNVGPETTVTTTVSRPWLLPSVNTPAVGKAVSNPVIGPSGIPGSQDFCGARDMGIARAGDMLTLVYSGYSTCDMGTYDHCGSIGCCQLMFATLSVPPVGKATRLGTVLPAPGTGFYNVTTDAYILWQNQEQEPGSVEASGETAGQWHMWVTEMPTGVVPPNQRGGLRNIGHLVATGTQAAVPTTGWTYQDHTVFPPLNLTSWAPLAVDEPRVYPRVGGTGWIMCVSLSLCVYVSTHMVNRASPPPRHCVFDMCHHAVPHVQPTH